MESDKIVYKGNDGVEYYVIAYPEMVAKRRSDPSSVRVMDVIERDEIFTTSKKSSSGGDVIRPSGGQLQSGFGMMSHSEILQTIVDHGEDRRMKTSKNRRGSNNQY